MHLLICDIYDQHGCKSNGTIVSCLNNNNNVPLHVRRWSRGEASRREVKKAVVWLSEHLQVGDVAVVAVTNTSWLTAIWQEQQIAINGSKTDYRIVRAAAARSLPTPPEQPTEGQLLALLHDIIGIYEAKASKHIEGKCNPLFR